MKKPIPECSDGNTGKIPKPCIATACEEEVLEKFPLQADTKLLGLSQDYYAILVALQIKYVYQLYERQYTCSKLRHLMPVDICTQLNQALESIGLPTLDQIQPDHVIYDFFTERKRARLKPIQVEILRSAYWGRLPDETVAREMQISPDEIPHEINDALNRLQMNS